MTPGERQFIQDVADDKFNGDLDAAIQWIMGSAACEECEEEHQAMHFGKRNQCCMHYIKSGNPPADWHPGCMNEYNGRR